MFFPFKIEEVEGSLVYGMKISERLKVPAAAQGKGY